jgi:peptidoglycan DL-endopeptidase CwlO
MRALAPVLVVVCMAPLSVLLLSAVSAGSAGASTLATGTLSAAQAKASQLEQEIQSTGQQIGVLDQQYEEALAQKAAVDQQIAATETQISKTEAKIASDRHTLRKAAVEAYVTGGTASGQATPFSGAGTASLDATVYEQVVTGNLNTSMAQYDTAVAQLDVQRQTLRSEDTQAAQAVAASQAAQDQAETLESQQQAALDQVNGQIAALIAQQQAVTDAAETTAAQADISAARAAAGSSSDPPPPPASGNAGTVAVAAAETQLGVPYVWGGATPGVGFDCSGLVMWAWEQAGVDLPHYSGAQMADTTPVPISDLEPGDLLFYGPGGSQHVAMYIGNGQVIEATFTGTVVRIDPVRFGTTFAGAGRP